MLKDETPTNMTQQVLYLDFDGVLHPAPVYRHHKRGIYFGVEHSGHKLFENVSALVAALAPYPAVSVVLSTSWVHVLGYSRARSFYPNLFVVEWSERLFTVA